MIFTLPKKIAQKKFFLKRTSSNSDPHIFSFISEKHWSYITILLASFCLMLIFIITSQKGQQLIAPFISPLHSLSEEETKKGHEVFGFAPYWTIDKLDNVDFSILTTLAYFGVSVKFDGSVDKNDYGYSVFQSQKATDLFKKAHAHGTRVVLTITQMDNETIESFLANPQAQKRAIDETVALVKERGIDGINVDFEYVGDPGFANKKAFSQFVAALTERMHSEVPASHVTVSVYASSASSNKLYDIQKLANAADGIFMMAYDFAVKSSQYAVPTAPLYGKKEGQYEYDVATAVEDFLKVMPPHKLILGVPYYGYNYPVQNVAIKAPRHPGYFTYYWYRYRQYKQYHNYSAKVQTYSLVQEDIIKANVDIQTGWDEYGRVGYIAYQEDGVWRMVFMEDSRSLGEKYDFAKLKNLSGVGIWALGFDAGNNDLWDLLRKKFGPKKFADSRIINRPINESN